MTETKSESGSHSQPTHVQQPGELQHIQTTYRLDGKNYLKWSQLVRTILKGKGKISHLTGTGPKPEDPLFKAWDEEDSMIMAWLWSSMVPEISDTMMFMANAKDIWNAVQETYSKAKDAAQVYEVKVKTMAAKQGSKTVTEYANQLKSLWQELDHYRVIKTKCPEDATILKEFIEQDRVYDFLVGLNSEFDQVRIQILGKPEVPCFNEVVAVIRSEESRRTLMLESLPTNGSAMVGGNVKIEAGRMERRTTYESGSGKNDLPRAQNRDGLWCTYCKKARHTKENCWKIHGKPPSHEWGQKGASFRDKGQAHVAVNPKQEDGKRETTSLNQEEMEKLRSFFSTLEKPSGSLFPPTGICSLAYSGKHCSSFGFNVSGLPLKYSWIMDSGATDHMTHSSNLFSTYSPCPSNKKIATADGSLTTVAGRGDVQISPSIILKNVLHVPKLSTNLVSIQKLTQDLHCKVIFYNEYCEFQEKDSGRMIGRAKEKDGLYCLEIPAKTRLSHSLISESTLSNKEKIFLHHRRLGHPSFRIVKILFPSLFSKLDVENLHCEVCELAKHKRVPFPVSNKRSTSPFYLIHTDIWGPSNVSNISGARWFVTFIDDCTRVTWVFLLKHKSDVSSVLPSFLLMIKNQFGVNIKRLRSDNARDYFNQTLTSYCQKEGIIHESSCVKTPQQNGVAERKNGHLLDQTRALLFQRNVPKHFWGEAVLTATYLINRLPTRMLGFKSPMEMLSTFYPSISISNNLVPRIFGCVSFVHIHSQERGKLDPRALKCIFTGYSSTQKGYKCYHPPTKKFFVSRDVTFSEKDAYFTQPYLQGENQREDKGSLENFLLSDLSPNSTHIPEHDPNSTHTPEPVTHIPDHIHSSQVPEPVTSNPVPEPTPNTHIPEPEDIRVRKNLVYSRQRRSIPDPEQVRESDSDPLNEVTISDSPSLQNESEFPIGDQDPPIAFRKGKRECTKRPLYPLSHYLSFQKFSPTYKAFLVNLNSITIPTTLSEALSDEKWKQAMNVEMQALEKNKTWDWVNLPEGKRAVGCKWVYTVKYKADGSIERYKARLVAKGYTQTFGIDYLETFAPVAKMNTVRVILSLAANLGWELHQFDVKNAFLHGELEEEIYMEVPPGYEKRMGTNTVCKLKKALYGLKQSPRAWFGRFSKTMVSLGYNQSQGDHTLFIKHSNEGRITVLLVYVDDIIVTGNDKKEQQALSQRLAKEFEIKTLGRLKYFLGIEVAHSRKGIFISQQKYVTDLLIETGQGACKPASTPIDPNHKLGNAEEDAMVNKEMYQRLVGRLIYLSHTRPDIAYAVSVISQFMHNPKETHLRAAHRILQYLKGTPGKGILFERNNSVTLEAYTDASYATSPVDCRSTTGYCTFLGGNLVTWRSKKQSVVARSSAEAEFRAMAHGICELLWLKIILTDLKINWERPMKLYCDNKSAINIAHNPVQHDRTKHIEVDRHFIKEKLDSGLICTPFVPTHEQLADILTKGLSRPMFEKITSKLGMGNSHSPA